MTKCDIEDMASPEDIGSGNYGIVEFFVAKNRDEISSTHIEKDRLFVSLASMCPSKQEGFVEKMYMLGYHAREF